jgi:ubiquitin-protein ligase
MTKIYHPNVSERGEICVNTLKKDWNSSNWNLYYIFEVLFEIFKKIGNKMFTNRSISRKFS